ncbi:MAG TPA: DUF1232 domain-containing protein [Thermomicrobiales bacterium]|nr:DUF1232 domain-containing protein [Thermomicrobiales bacterium]
MVDEVRGRQASNGGFDAGFLENAALSWRLYRDPRVSVWLKRLPIVLAFIYLVLPLDLIPDMLLGVGQLDDIGIMGLMALSLTWLPKFAPAEVVAEHKAKMRSGGGARASGRTADDKRARRVAEHEDIIEPPFRVDR